MTSFTNRARAQQLLDFKGLTFGKCSPTDIDMSMDWQGKSFLFVEVKGNGKMLTAGQKYHLEGLCKAIAAGGKTAYAILAHHTTKSTEDIIAADCTIGGIYDGISKKWDTEFNGMDLGLCLDKLHQIHLEEYPKGGK